MKRVISSSHKSAFTVAEVLVSLLILGIVTAICAGSYLVFQKGFNFIANWSDLNNSLCRVVDTIGIDLRNSSGSPVIDLTTGQVKKMTITVPSRYAGYYTGDTARAGDPSSTAAGSGNVTIVYSGITNGTQTRILRKVTWSGQSATRTVATFPRGATMTSSLDGKLCTVLVTGTTVNGKSVSSGTMRNTVYLRGK